MTEVINHVGVKVSDFGRSKAFYLAALGTLGVKLLAEFEFDGKHYAGFGTEHPSFWIDDAAPTRGGTHIAFNAGSRAAVRAFFSAALASGGRDNGPPGIRAHYSENYYAAFVHDPDGHNIEAVSFAAQ